MNTMSVSRLGGVCLLGGGILGFIPFVLQIMVGGPPEEGPMFIVILHRTLLLEVVRV